MIIDEIKDRKGVKNDIDLDVNDMKELVKRFKEYYKEQKGTDFPTDPKTQMMEPSRLFSVRGTTPAPTYTAA